MIIFGFADTLNECATTLAGDNPRAHNIIQDIMPERRLVAQPISGAAGVYDFYGDTKWPGEQAIARVEFDMMGNSFGDAGERAQALVDALKKRGRSRLWFVTREDYRDNENPVSPSFFKNAAATGTIAGVTRRGGLVQANTRVKITLANGDVVASTVAGADGSYSVDVPVGTYSVVGEVWQDAFPDELAYVDRYDDTETGIVVTDGVTTSQNLNLNLNAAADSQPTRWAWAKLRQAAVVENSSDNLIDRARVVAEFVLTESVMYSALIRFVTKDEAAAATFNLTSLGSGAAAIKLTLQANVNSITAFRLTNNGDDSYVNYAGAVAAGALNVLIIDSDAYSVTNAGVNDYANLTLNTGQVAWSYIDTIVGATTQSFTVAVTQTSPNWDLTIVYRDTYDL